MKHDLISIILPFYNEEQYISQSLQSVLNSDYPELEIICIDDGSTDSSVQKVKTFHDPRIQLISQPNLGISAARNAGLRASRGKYIFFLDADDQIRPDYLSKMHAAAVEHQAQVVISNYQIENERGTVLLPSLNEGLYEDVQSVFFDLYASSHFNPPWNKLYLKEIIHEEFDPNLSLGEDLVFNLATLAECSSLYILDEDGYSYTKRKDGLHNQPQSTRELLYLYDQIQKYMNLRTPQYKWHIQKHFVRHCYEQRLQLLEEIPELRNFFLQNDFSYHSWNSAFLVCWSTLYRIKRRVLK